MELGGKFVRNRSDAKEKGLKDPWSEVLGTKKPDRWSGQLDDLLLTSRI